jgi:hypothetical protein
MYWKSANLASLFYPNLYPNGVANIGANGGEGHSDPAMTFRRHAHILEGMRKDAARAMDELFSW